MCSLLKNSKSHTKSSDAAGDADRPPGAATSLRRTGRNGPVARFGNDFGNDCGSVADVAPLTFDDIKKQRPVP